MTLFHHALHGFKKSATYGNKFGYKQFLLSVCIMPLSLAAQVYTWDGSAEGGNWDSPANWTVAGGTENNRPPFPVGPAGAVFPSTQSDRNVIFSGATATTPDGETHANYLRDITFHQDTVGINQLTIEHPLTLGNHLVLRASDAGVVRLAFTNARLEPTITQNGRKTTPALRFEMGFSKQPARHLTIKQGGVLDLGGIVYDQSNVAFTLNRANVILSGGDILLRQGVKSGADRSISYNLNAQLAIESGTVNFNASAIDGKDGLNDVRLFVGGSFILRNGHLANRSEHIKTLWLNGASNLILSGASIDPKIQITLGSTKDQRIDSSIPLPAVLIRQDSTAIKSIAVHCAGRGIGQISFIQSRAATAATLRLESDLNATLPPQASPIAAPTAGSEVHYVIDTNGHTLDLTASGEPWQLNRPSDTVTAHWLLTGGGTICADGFDFASTGVSVSVTPGTTLRDASGRIVNP